MPVQLPVQPEGVDFPAPDDPPTVDDVIAVKSDQKEVDEGSGEPPPLFFLSNLSTR
jgi:hypothetical protein